MKTSNLALVLCLGIMTSACKPLEQNSEFFEKSEVLGIDAFCVEGVDEVSCQAIPGCKAAYAEASEGGAGPFEACVGDPDYHDPNGDSSSGGSSSGGSSSGGPESDSDGPTLVDVEKDCSGVDESYLYIKRIVKENHTKLIKKAKVCHHSKNGKSRNIIIACPAVKAHVNHHNDYLGLCEND